MQDPFGHQQPGVAVAGEVALLPIAAGHRFQEEGLQHACLLSKLPSFPPALPAPHHPALQGKTRLARAKYGRALKVVERAMDLETEEQVAEASRLKASCLLNMARCAEREQEWGEARSWCTKAIKCVPLGRWGGMTGRHAFQPSRAPAQLLPHAWPCQLV